MVGRTLGHYRIVEPIGAGGMGEVYRARDEKLGRDVALKVLPAGSLDDEHARKRFRKEADALSRLTHPHIASLYDFDTTDDGTDFLVMELVSGPSLQAKLKSGPLPERDVVRLGTQILHALVAAHGQGVLHRDLKPQNLKLTADGFVKVLDFGLARVAPARVEGETTDTASGSVAGTPPYMSPEQLLGKDVDARTDVYAAGVVLYEMATGRRPYGEASGPQLVAKILGEDAPPPREVNPALSPVLEHVILKAADKNRERRHQTARDLLVDLEHLASGATGPALPGPHREASARWRRVLPALLGVTLLLGLGAGLLWLARPRELRIASIRTLVPEPMGPVDGLETDGTHVYYAEGAGTDRLMKVPLAGGIPEEIPVPWRGGGDLGVVSLRLDPLSLLICRDRDLFRLALPGGAATRLGVDARQCIAAWSRDGDRLAWIEEGPRADQLSIGNADGTDRRLLAEVLRQEGEGLNLWLVGWAPRGEQIRYVRGDRPDALLEVKASGGTHQEALVLSPELAGSVYGRPEWTPDGRWFLWGGRAGLFAFSEPAVGSAAREPRLLPAPSHIFWMRSTPDGRRLVGFVSRPASAIVRIDPRTKAITSLLGGARASSLRYSPDGSEAAWISADGHLWLSRPDGTQKVQLSDLSVPGGTPLRWSPDGKRIAFAAHDEGAGLRVRVYLATPRTGVVELLAPDDPNEKQSDPCWSPDGDWLAYGASPSEELPADSDLFLRRVDLATRAVTKLSGSEGLWSPKCAPDGRLLASDYFAQRAGEKQAAVETGGAGRVYFKLRDPATGDWAPLTVTVPSWGGNLVSLPGGDLIYPTWSHDGRHVYGYLNSRATVVRFALGSLRLETIIDVEGLGGAYSSWMDLDPTDAPLVHRDATKREIVVIDWE